MKIKTIITFLAIFISLTVSGQKEGKSKTIKGVQGRYEISLEISEAQARERALGEAKREALRRGGISENVWSVFGLITAQDGEKFSEVYSEMSMLAQNGLVNLISNPQYSIVIDPTDNKRYAVATIDAQVKEGEQPDNTYQLVVNGVDPVYKVGDKMRFSLKPIAHDSYFHVFWFDNDGTGSMIYPIRLTTKDGRIIEEPLRLIPKDHTLSLPCGDSGYKINYRITKTNPANATETINVIVVATKKEYRYLSEEVTFESLMKWIFNISPSERTVYYQLVNIK
jgi:hypothetical protein